MPKYSLILNNEIDSLNKSLEVRHSMGFLIKYKSINYIISIHHFLPITTTNLISQSKLITLKKIKEINWNELSIFYVPNGIDLKKNTIIKNIDTQFYEPKTLIKMEIDDEFKIFECFGYIDFSRNPLSKLSNLYLMFYIGNEKDNQIDLYKFPKLSGSPVFLQRSTENEKNKSNDMSLIGIFCKIKSDDKGNIYGMVLPSIYLIKSLIKKNNKDFFFVNSPYENLKIENHRIEKDESGYLVDYKIVNNKIPLNIFLSIEGDDTSTLKIKDTSKNEIINIEKEVNFDISLDIIKKDNKYKLNNGLFSLLVKNNFEIDKIIEDYKKRESLNDIWISFNDTNQIDL